MCSLKFRQWFVAIIIVDVCLSTIDINIHQLQFVADHLEENECKKLSEALREPKFAVPVKLITGENEPDLPCIALLLKWDRTQGAGKSTIDLSLRLHQIGRGDLGKKLSKLVFDESAQELQEEFLDDPFKNKIVKDSFLLASDSDPDDIRRELQSQTEDSPTDYSSAGEKLDTATVKAKTSPEIVNVVKSASEHEPPITKPVGNTTKPVTNDVESLRITDFSGAQTPKPTMKHAKKDIGSSDRRADPTMRAAQKQIQLENKKHAPSFRPSDAEKASTFVEPNTSVHMPPRVQQSEEFAPRKVIDSQQRLTQVLKSHTSADSLPKIDADTETIEDDVEDEGNSGLAGWEIVSIGFGVFSLVAIFSYVTYYLCGAPIARMFKSLAPNGVVAWCDLIVFKECFFFNAKKGYTTDVDELAFIMRSLNYSPTLEEVNSYFQKYVKDAKIDFALFLEVMHDQDGKIDFASFLEVMHYHNEKESSVKKSR